MKRPQQSNWISIGQSFHRILIKVNDLVKCEEMNKINNIKLRNFSKSDETFNIFIVVWTRKKLCVEYVFLYMIRFNRRLSWCYWLMLSSFDLVWNNRYWLWQVKCSWTRSEFSNGTIPCDWTFVRNASGQCFSSSGS